MLTYFAQTDCIEAMQDALIYHPILPVYTKLPVLFMCFIMFLWLINMLDHGGTSTTAHKTVFDYFSSLIPDAVFTDVDTAFWHFAT